MSRRDTGKDQVRAGVTEGNLGVPIIHELDIENNHSPLIFFNPWRGVLKMKITVIGAGNGGHAIAGHFAMLGHQIRVYARNLSKLGEFVESREIYLSDKIVGVANVDIVTDNIEEALSGAEIIMVATTASAHRDIASKIAPYVENNQIIVLNPGRTLGAYEFYDEIKKYTSKHLYIAEAQSLIYACRTDAPGRVRIIGIKDKVLLSSFPSLETDYVLSTLNSIIPCFVKAKNILHTGLENIGAILHPSVMIFNAAAIERGNLFYFYNEMTPAVANFIESIDLERLMIGSAFGIELLSVSNWVSYAYKNIIGVSFLDKVRNNPAYYKILAPNTLFSRLLLEDVPTGILPMIELANMVNIDTPLMKSIVTLSQSLLGIDFYTTGRTFKNLGIDGIGGDNFIERL